MKRKGKETDSTINDLVLTLLSLSLNEYFVIKGDIDQKSVNLGVPVSSRRIPDTIW